MNYTEFKEEVDHDKNEIIMDTVFQVFQIVLTSIFVLGFFALIVHIATSATINYSYNL